MYVTLKLDDNGCCRIHSISDDGNGWVVTDKRYVVMPWKMVTRHGKNMTLAEAVDGIFSRHESEAKEQKRREREKERIEKKRKEYYEAHMKEETERLNKISLSCFDDKRYILNDGINIFMTTKYPINCLCEGHIFAMPGNHFPGHNHVPFVGNYPSIPIIRNAVNPATPIIIQFKSHIHFI